VDCATNGRKAMFASFTKMNLWRSCRTLRFKSFSLNNCSLPGVRIVAQTRAGRGWTAGGGRSGVFFEMRAALRRCRSRRSRRSVAPRAMPPHARTPGRRAHAGLKVGRHRSGWPRIEAIAKQIEREIFHF
jgi:hypothetical protein